MIVRSSRLRVPASSRQPAGKIYAERAGGFVDAATVFDGKTLTLLEKCQQVHPGLKRPARSKTSWTRCGTNTTGHFLPLIC